jgi:hypothetical protein
MPENNIPFSAQTALLDGYIKAADPTSDQAALAIVLEAIREKPDLRHYFFRNRPHPSWATLLWEHGFLTHAPEPIAEGDIPSIPFWDAQEYLLSVAEHAPQILVEHIKSIQGHPRYKGRAILGVQFIQADLIREVLPLILEWLSDRETSRVIAEDAYELMVSLAKKKNTASLELFRALTTPYPSVNTREIQGSILGGEAISLLTDVRWSRRLENSLSLLIDLDPQNVAGILDKQLRLALKIEAETTRSPETEYMLSSWWRSAIEDTSQDIQDHFKDTLLEGLRDALAVLVNREREAAEQIIATYSNDRHEILRRLRLHILSTFPLEFKEQVVDELLKSQNYDDTGVHHEFFTLLKRGFTYLSREEQSHAERIIIQGPPKEAVESFVDWWSGEENQEKRENHVKGYIRRWIRDRLFMIREHLEGRPKELLNEIIAESGEPEHPDFTHWSSGAYMVAYKSPLNHQHLASMSPEELVTFLKQWQPDTGEQLGPEVINYRGLAGTLASVVLSDPTKYKSQFIVIGLLRPEFAYSLLHLPQSSDESDKTPILTDDNNASDLWPLYFDLSEAMLDDEVISKDMSRTSEINWRDARKEIVNLIETGLKKSKKAERGGIPKSLLPRARDILIKLTEDPDPDAEGDKPKAGWVGHNDPVTVAINHVRSDAFLALIEDYALHTAYLNQEKGINADPEGPGPNRLEPEVEDVLAKKLDKHADASWAVHSIYGRTLTILYWLNKDWVASHLDEIFPGDSDEQSNWYYIAAWDSYVIFNKLHYKDLFALLYPKYVKAIDNLSVGLVTRTHLEPERRLASHLLGEYLYLDQKISIQEIEESLLGRFFQKAPPQTRGSAIWLLWKTLEQQINERDMLWIKAKELWQWRVDVASSYNHSNDFDNEMEWFPHLLEFAPMNETITSLWPVLEGLLPYLSRTRHLNMVWEEVEKFLLREVERDSLRVIQFYRLMHEGGKRPTWSRGQEGRKILELGAANKESRNATLSLIDLIFQSGDPQYQDIYNRYAR